MSKFAYRIQDQKAEVMEGVLEAANEAQAQKFLADRQYEILSLKVVKERKTLKGFLARFEKVNTIQFNFFVRQLATMLKAGVPLLPTLLTLQEGSRDPILKQVIQEIYNDVEKGNSFSQAITRHPKVFTTLFCSTVKSGEAIGELDTVLLRLADILEKDYQIAVKVRSAMFYPCIATFFVVAAFLAAMLFIIPQFRSIFSSFGAELPLPTRILLVMSDTVRTYWYIVLAGIVGVVIAIRYHYKSFSGRRFWDAIMLRIKVLGDFLKNAIYSRFARMFGLMLKSGVNLLQGLELIAEIVNNSIISDSILRIKTRVEQGDSLSNQMRVEGTFPVLLVQIVHVGEESGKMDDLLIQVAEFYDTELEMMVKNMEALIEPFFIIFLGIFVSVLALGVFLPMWNIFEVIQQSAM